MKLLILSLTLAVGSFSALSLLPTAPAHLSVNGRTLCGSPIGHHVDVLSAHGKDYCSRCTAVIADSDATE